MTERDQHLDTLQDIRKMMQRSSRFISLSGLSGIAAGIWALAGAYFAHKWIAEYYNRVLQATPFSEINRDSYLPYNDGDAFNRLRLNLVLLAFGVMMMAFLSAFYFTWRRAARNKQPLWDHTAKLLTINTMIPVVTGGVFILAMLQHNEWRFVAPGCLIFYGLALVSGGRYTLSEIRYLGFTEIVLGMISTQFIGYGLYFWTVGFGILHLLYGFFMWWKYERKDLASS